MVDTGRPIPQVQKLNYNGEDIGMGFNSDTGLAVGTPLDFNAATSNSSQEAETDITIISSHEELVSKMHMSAKLEGHYSIVSAGGKTDFLESTAYNSSSTFVMAKMVIGNTVTRGTSFKLKPEVDTILKQDQKAFDKAFGDSFVRAQYTGGEFYAVMRITSVDAKTESKLAVSAHAAVQGGVAAASFQFALDQANTSENTQSDFSVSYYQKGGAGADEIGTTLSIAEITDRLHKFPNAVKDHPYPYFIEVATYDTLPLPLDAKMQQQDFLDALQDANSQKLVFLQGRNDCNFAADHPEFFINPPAQATLRANAEIYTQLVNAVITHALAISRGEPPLLFDPAKLVPPLVVPSIKLVKKDVGVSATFTELWVNKDKPGTSKSDRLLVTSVGLSAVSSIHGFYDIKDPSGDPDATLRLQGQALGRALGSVRDYDYVPLVDLETNPQLTSLAALPNMLPASIRSLAFRFNAIPGTQGLDQFRSLAKLDLTWNAVDTIDELGSLTLLKELILTANSVTDLGPLSSCAMLETLDISGNQITDLTPLASCKSLKALTLVNGSPIQGGETRPVGNPIANVLPLSKVPALANPFTLGKTLAVRAGNLTDGPDKQYHGTATRIGSSYQFQAHLTRGAETLDEIWTLSFITPLQPPFKPMGGLFWLVAQPGEAPPEGIMLNILRDASLKLDWNLCFVSANDPKTAVADLTAYPGFAKLRFPTIDASVIS